MYKVRTNLINVEAVKMEIGRLIIIRRMKISKTCWQNCIHCNFLICTVIVSIKHPNANVQRQTYLSVTKGKNKKAQDERADLAILA